ncbi:GIP [Symbiodinium necroappetens]|uniref:GIP protein n=1 Tax=Symbiodinium necroappetens TaxID=1628268 RepID=A0A812YVB8_9DINO|nr:GIP [Symbiodinium necroappetens]
MDSLIRRRGAGAKDPEEASVAREPDYTAALSQAGAPGASGIGMGDVPVNGLRAGEVSPGTLESGKGVGKPVGGELPMANPFHSDKVRAEVDLIRSRPVTLDGDATRLGLEAEGPALGEISGNFPLEPNYSAMMGAEPGRGDAPRVARVEASADSPSREFGRGDMVREELVGKEARGESSREPDSTVEAEESRRDPVETVEPRDQDDRELIPVELDRLGKMENLLLQVMEENKSLKRRLEWKWEVEVSSEGGRTLGRDIGLRLALDPGSIIAVYDQDDIIMNRFVRVFLKLSAFFVNGNRVCKELQKSGQRFPLLQAESEAVALVDSSVGSDKRAKAAALSAAKESGSVRPPPPPPPKVAAEVSIAVVGAGSGDKKGKGKGKSSDGTTPGCYKFADGSGCKFGDACMFKHDRSKARKDGRCLACGQAGHFRPDCPLVAPENRPVVSEQSSDGSPNSSGGKAKAKAKAKSGVQAKGVTEEKGEAAASSASGAAASLSATVSQEALVAEATKLLKGVSLRALTLGEVDSSWLRSALASASDPEYCLVDSGATNALRPAEDTELEGCKVIRVDLASGGADLRINGYGTLLHVGQCQVILPASYLVELGYVISWKRKRCKIKHPRLLGLKLLQEYEERKAGRPVLSKAEIEDLGGILEPQDAKDGLTDWSELPGIDGLGVIGAVVKGASSRHEGKAAMHNNQSSRGGSPNEELVVPEVGAESQVFLAFDPVEMDSHIHPMGPTRSAEGQAKVALEALEALGFGQGCPGVGPLISGLSWNVESSGRDQGKGYKYFLACAYTVPKGYELRVDDEPVAAEAEFMEDELEAVREHPDREDPVGQGPAGSLPALDLLELPEGPGLCAVSFRVKGKQPERETGGSDEEKDDGGGVGPLPPAPVESKVFQFSGTTRIELRRTQTGYQSQWESRSKRSAPFAVKVVAAADVSVSSIFERHGLEFQAPEGECEVLGSFEDDLDTGESGEFLEAKVREVVGRYFLVFMVLGVFMGLLELREPIQRLFGGGLWIEDEYNDGPVGEVRWVISAFTPRDVAATTDDHWKELEELGFPAEVPEEVEWDVCFPVPIVDEEVRVGLERRHDVESSSFTILNSYVSGLRCRAVCCGNYLPTEKLGLTREDLYASGAESLSVKIALIFAAGHPSWTGVTIDVKSAFLYAPIRSDTKGTEERIIVKPPNFLLELGIMTKDDRWWIRKALYGLPTSPRDWGRYRDAEFAQFRLRWGEDEYHLVQTLSDDALWVARKATKAGYGDTAGLLVVYVDDLLFLAPKGLGEAFVRAVQERWKTSMPEWLSTKPLTFCGMELSQHDNGYHMGQNAYGRELLGRYSIDESSATPITRWTEPEVGPPPLAEEVKEAQAITGALLWLSSTLDVGIDVPYEVGSTFSDHGCSSDLGIFPPIICDFVVGRGLALLALLPRVQGQPAEDRLGVSWSWVSWTFGMVVACVVGLWVGWCASGWFGPILVGGFEDLVGVDLSGPDEEAESGAQSSSSDGALFDEVPFMRPETNPGVALDPQPGCGLVEAGSGSEGGSEDDDFTHQEWLAVQAKLERVERFTGLTSIQRCRLRRALALGDIIEPPVFQQRFGAPPEWLTSGGGEASENTGELCSEVASQVGEAGLEGYRGVGFLRILDLPGGRLLGYLGFRSVEWNYLRRTARAVFHHALMVLVARFQDTGVPHTLPVGMTGRVEFHFVAVDGDYRWVPGELFVGEGSDEGAPNAGPQVRGSSSEVPSDTGLQVPGSSSEVPSDTGLQVPGSSSEVPSDTGLQVPGSLSEVPSDTGLQVGGSSSLLPGEDSVWNGDLSEGWAGQVGTFPVSSVQVGGSASSTDPCPPTNHQHGGSSNSHGMGHQQASWGLTYEDLTGGDVELEDFPLVGVWFRTHFLVQVFSVSGAVVLGWLGTRVPEWLCLRSASSAVRHAFSASVAEALRGGPYMVMFSGPQWQIAVDEYVLTGYPLNEEDTEVEPQGGPLSVAEGAAVGFPYVEWPPTVVVHFLWRVFALCGSRILACLGDRTREWGYMYASAKGFRSHVVYALICWLRSTGIQRMVDGPISYDAAQAYLHSGVRSYPFEEASEEEDLELDERPHRAPLQRGPVLHLRPVVDELLHVPSSEEDVSSSTAEPSETFAELSDGNEGEGTPQRPPQQGIVYMAGEGVLFCLYGDDCVQVPLQGWSMSDVAAIVQGLNTGDWSDFQRVMSEGTLTAPGIQDEPRAPLEDELRGGALSSGLSSGSSSSVGIWGWHRRCWIFLLLLWLEVQAVRACGVEIEEDRVEQCSEDQGVMLWKGSPLDQDAVMPEGDWIRCDGSVFWEISKVVVVVLIWEIVRRSCCSGTASVRKPVDAESQTTSFNIVPLPLSGQVRCRAKILFCLWRAGFKIDAEGYPERIQSEFHALVGGYMLRVESGGITSSDSD